jgi:hypothetical protein
VSRPVLRSKQPTIQWVPGALPTTIKRPGCEPNNSHQCYAVVNNVRSDASIHSTCHHGTQEHIFLKLQVFFSTFKQGCIRDFKLLKISFHTYSQKTAANLNSTFVLQFKLSLNQFDVMSLKFTTVRKDRTAYTK